MHAAAKTPPCLYLYTARTENDEVVGLLLTARVVEVDNGLATAPSVSRLIRQSLDNRRNRHTRLRYMSGNNKISRQFLAKM